jgi:hypothetical protein
LTAERGILGGIFALILVGLGILSAWLIYSFLWANNMIIAIALIPLSWGLILLVMYLAFRALDMSWWDR